MKNYRAYKYLEWFECILQPRKRVQSAKARIAYIAPAPKQKPAVEEEEELVKERLYKIEVFTSEVALAGTNANVS